MRTQRSTRPLLHGGYALSALFGHRTESLGLFSRRRGLLGHSLVIAGLLALPGCSFLPSHIHNEGKAVAARQARDAMAEYSKNAPKMYSAMLANVDRFKAEEAYLLTELASNASDSFITKVPSMTWAALSEQITADMTGPGGLETLNTFLGDTAGKALGEKQGLVTNAKTLEDRVKAAKAVLNAAKQNVTNWNASVALFREAITQLPAAAGALSGSAAVRDVQAALSAAANKEIEYVDADGKTIRESIADTVRKRTPEVLDSFKEPGRGGSVLDKLPDAPGLDVVIATLGLDLAQIEQRRADVHLERVAQVTEILEDAEVQLKVAEKLLQPASTWIKAKGGGADARRNAFQEILRARFKVRAETPTASTRWDEAEFQPVLDGINNASTTLVNLRDVAVGESILRRVSSTTPVALARVQHTQSIVESSINDKMYQSFIRSGLAGLVAYHEGGLTSEDIANLIRFAQAVAVGVLAGRVD